MCSIVGMGFQRGHSIRSKTLVRDLITQLLLKGMIRGTTATGVCYTSTKEMAVVKDKVRATDFTTAEYYKKSLDDYVQENDVNKELMSVMGHCRQKTKGTEDNPANNHPIVYNNVVGVHNGIIVNDDDKFTSYRDNIPRKAQVDSEIIFALIDHFSRVLESIPAAIRKVSKELIGGYACAMVHRYQPHLLWLFRSGSPCTIHHFRDEGLIMFASLSSFIDEAVSKHKLGLPVEIPIAEQECIGIDLHRHKIQSFDLE